MKSNPICDLHHKIAGGFDSSTGEDNKYALCNLKDIDITKTPRKGDMAKNNKRKFL